MTNRKKTAPERETDGALRENESDEVFKIQEEVYRLSEELGIPPDEATRIIYEERGLKMQLVWYSSATQTVFRTLGSSSRWTATHNSLTAPPAG